MPGLKLYTSNRLEHLADALAEVLAEPLRSPFEPECILVQSRGMERWVSMELAERHGICANCRFPFPNHFVRELFGLLLPAAEDPEPFDPQVMTWRIMGLLPALQGESGFDSVRHYLGEDPDALKRFQLAERVAEVFDQYLLFRPDMILDWEKGRDTGWQARLWRLLAAGYEARHRAGAARRFLQRLGDRPADIAGLPERVAVFGISALPRFHLQILAALSDLVPVNLFLMNPCREHWGHIVTDRQIGLAAGESSEAADVADLHLETGNSLLASLGRLGRDFFDMIYDFPVAENAWFDAPGEQSMLTAVQSDILTLRDRGTGEDRPTALKPDDASVRVHVCHSPMREIEVLQDQLLQLFTEFPGLLPKDVLVMAPDIETYVPYIRAVFDLPANDPRRIPFRITDRALVKESRAAGAFLAVLDLWEGRFGATQVLNILESPAVRARFGLAETDLEPVHRWVAESGIRWGMDAGNRSALGLPETEENTWEAGRRRLLLGYALGGRGERLFQGMLPYGEIEGSQGLILGRLLAYVDALFTCVRALDEVRSPGEWARTLSDLLDALFAPDPAEEEEWLALRRVVQGLQDLEPAAEFHDPVPLPVIRHQLGETLGREAQGYGFMTGGVTFGALVPMRSIPFRVICLMGLNHDAYPRESRSVGFDLIARHPRRGDRSRRQDDRYLFLEALLSARQAFTISYVGRSLADNSPIPPSVLVSELLDYLKQGFRAADGQVVEQVVTEHRLQAFSPAYFRKGEERLFSYSEEHCRAARGLAARSAALTPFFDKELAEPEEALRSLSVEELCRFFANTARYLLDRRLGIRLEETVAGLDEVEPLDLKGLERYLLGSELLERRLTGRDPQTHYAAARAAGRLPHGAVGRCLYDEVADGVEAFARWLEETLQEPCAEPLDLDLHLGAFTLNGRIEGVTPWGLLRYRYGKINARDRLTAWIHHLALQSAASSPVKSLLAGLDPGKGVWSAVEYPPVNDSRARLEDLLDLYWQGLRRPLHFFPETAWAYVRGLRARNGGREPALLKARRVWLGNEGFTRGEGEDAAYGLALRHTAALDAEFEDTARRVFEPLAEL